mgnify:FL=1
MKRLVVFFFLILCSILLHAQNANRFYWPTSSGAVVEKSHYVLSYSEAHEQAEWVFYELTRQEAKGGYERTDDFRSDGAISTGSASLADYKGSGYDRGHLAPAGDMAFSTVAMSESFYMSNMSPQDPSFNRGIWKQLESLVRAWAQDDGDLFVVTGAILEDGLPTIGVNRVSIPRYYYKVVLDWDNNGQEVRSIAFVLPNQKGVGKLYHYAVSIDSVEALTGIDFFASFSDDLEAQFESTVTGSWDYSLKPVSRSYQKTNATAVSRCKGTTQSGSRCKRTTKSESGYCWQHESQTKTPASKGSSVRCSAYTQSGNRCKRMTKNLSGKCWQHE